MSVEGTDVTLPLDGSDVVANAKRDQVTMTTTSNGNIHYHKEHVEAQLRKEVNGDGFKVKSVQTCEDVEILNGHFYHVGLLDDNSSTISEKFIEIKNDSDLPGHVNNLDHVQIYNMYKLWISAITSVEMYGHCIGGLDKMLLTEEDTSVGNKMKRKLNLFKRKPQKGTDSNTNISESPSSDASSRRGSTSSEFSIQATLSASGTANNDPIFSSKSSLRDSDNQSISSVNSSKSISHNSSKFLHPSGKNSPVTTYAEEFWKGFISAPDDPDSNILRFLRARNWNFVAANAMLLGTLQWRAEQGVYDIVYEGEAAIKRSLFEKGKIFFHGTDLQGRLMIYARGKLHRQGDQTFEEQIRHTLFCMETGRRLLAPGIETVTLMFDMTDSSYANFDLGAVKFLIQCFQNHYPESLGCCLLLNSPWIFNTFWAMIKPYLDPVVVSKIQFVSLADLPKFISLDVLLKEYGGNNPFVYDYSFRLIDEPTSSKENLCSDEKASSTSVAGELSSVGTLGNLGTLSTESLIESRQLLPDLKEEFLALKNTFVQLTKTIWTHLAPFSSPEQEVSLLKSKLLELKDILEERKFIKDRLSKISREIDRLTLPKTFYHRLGIIDPRTSFVDWSKVKSSFKDVDSPCPDNCSASTVSVTPSSE